MHFERISLYFMMFGYLILTYSQPARYFKTPIHELIESELYVTINDYGETIVTYSGIGSDLKSNDYITHADGMRIFTGGISEFIRLGIEKEVVIPIVDESEKKFDGFRLVGFVQMSAMIPRQLNIRRGEIAFDLEEGGPSPTLKLGNIVFGGGVLKSTNDPTYVAPKNGGGSCISGRDCYNFNGTCIAGKCNCQEPYTGSYCQLYRPQFASIGLLVQQAEMQSKILKGNEGLFNIEKAAQSTSISSLKPQKEPITEVKVTEQIPKASKILPPQQENIQIKNENVGYKHPPERIEPKIEIKRENQKTVEKVPVQVEIKNIIQNELTVEEKQQPTLSISNEHNQPEGKVFQSVSESTSQSTTTDANRQVVVESLSQELNSSSIETSNDISRTLPAKISNENSLINETSSVRSASESSRIESIPESAIKSTPAESTTGVSATSLPVTSSDNRPKTAYERVKEAREKDAKQREAIMDSINRSRKPFKMSTGFKKSSDNIPSPAAPKINETNVEAIPNMLVEEVVSAPVHRSEFISETISDVIPLMPVVEPILKSVSTTPEHYKPPEVPETAQNIGEHHEEPPILQENPRESEEVTTNESTKQPNKRRKVKRDGTRRKNKPVDEIGDTTGEIRFESTQRNLENDNVMDQQSQRSALMQGLYGEGNPYPEPYTAGKVPSNFAGERQIMRFQQKSFVYSVRFRSGPMGIQFDNRLPDATVVEKVVKGDQADISDVKPGDKLIAIDQYNLTNAPAKASLRLMATLPWPRILVFETKSIAIDPVIMKQKLQERRFNLTIIYPPSLATEFEIRIAEWSPAPSIHSPVNPLITEQMNRGGHSSSDFCPVYRVRTTNDLFGCAVEINQADGSRVNVGGAGATITTLVPHPEQRNLTLPDYYDQLIAAKGYPRDETVKEQSPLLTMLLQEANSRGIVTEPRSLAMVKRGLCTFVEKGRALMANGAHLGVVVNNEDELIDLPAGKEKTDDLQMPIGVAADKSANLVQLAASTNEIWAVITEHNNIELNTPCTELLNVADDIIERWPHSHPKLSLQTIQQTPMEKLKVRGMTEEGGRIAVSGENGWAFFDYHLAMFGPQNVPLGPYRLQMAFPPYGCDPNTYTVRIQDTIVAILRGGGCSFGIKVINAQKLGAKAVIIVNTDDMKTMRLMALPDEVPLIKIPCIMNLCTSDDDSDDYYRQYGHGYQMGRSVRRLRDKCNGLIIYATPGSGKIYLYDNYTNVIDGDDVLLEIISDISPNFRMLEGRHPFTNIKRFFAYMPWKGNLLYKLARQRIIDLSQDENYIVLIGSVRLMYLADLVFVQRNENLVRESFNQSMETKEINKCNQRENFEAHKVKQMNNYLELYLHDNNHMVGCFAMNLTAIYTLLCKIKL